MNIAAKVKSDLRKFFVDILHKTIEDADEFYDDYYKVDITYDEWSVNMVMREFASDTLLDEPDIRRRELIPQIDCVIPSTVGGDDGVISMTFQDGELPIQYWMKPEADMDWGDAYLIGRWTGLSAGVYDVKAQDANGYVAEYEYHLNDPYVLTLEKTDCTTYGGTDGTITASAAGRTAPYTYSLDGITYQATGLFENLEAGVYTVYAKDDNEEVTSEQITVGEPDATLTLVETDCTTNGGSDGSITATAVGVNAPFTYSIDGVNYQASGLFENLIAGTYTIYAKDSLDVVITEEGIVGEPGA